MPPEAPQQGCPLCGSASDFAFFTTDRNRHASDVQFRYEQCAGCQVLFLADPPDDLARYYDVGDYYHIPDRSELAVSCAREAYKVDVMRAHATSGRIVDVGPSFGGFPYLAKRAGYEVAAIEIDKACCEFIESEIGVRAVHSGQPELALGEFQDLDAVTLWHSIEHLAQPWRTIEAAVAALRPQGVLIIATPNPVGIQARLLRSRWVHVDAPRHLFLIPPAALAARTTALGTRLATTFSDDEETGRCNFLAWYLAVRGVGISRPQVIERLTKVVVRAVRPLERQPTLGSAYTSVFVKA